MAVSGSDEQYKAEGTGSYLLEFCFGGKTHFHQQFNRLHTFSFSNKVVFYEH